MGSAIPENLNAMYFELRVLFGDVNNENEKSLILLATDVEAITESGKKINFSDGMFFY
jgi:hypothetical protein